MLLQFKWSGIEQLLDEVRNATHANPLWEQETGKGLRLVGDHGVYLMANTSDGPREKARKSKDPRFVVYAEECNPETLPFDTWWAAKRASFGGDDGVELIPLADIEQLIANPPHEKAKPHSLIISFQNDQHVQPGSFTLSLHWSLRRADAVKTEP